MSNVIGSLYREEAQAWRERYRKYFKYAARALGLGFVAGYLFFILWPAQEKRALAFVVQAFKDIPLEAGPFIMALTIFYHNVRASVLATATGLVPFLFIPIFDPILNGAVLGLLVSAGQHRGVNVPKLVLTQILPHGVIEIAAFVYTTSLGLHLCAEVGRRVRRARQECRKRKGRLAGRRTFSDPRSDLRTDPSDQQGAAAGAAVPEGMPEGRLSGGPAPASPCQAGLLRDLVRSFVLVVLPLLLVAAIIEAFVTPHLR